MWRQSDFQLLIGYTGVSRPIGREAYLLIFADLVGRIHDVNFREKPGGDMASAESVQFLLCTQFSSVLLNSDPR